MNNIENPVNMIEQPATNREQPATNRERFEAKYGDESEVMRTIIRWRNVATDFNQPYNSEMETPVTEADMDVAESAMLAEIRKYGAQKQISDVTEDMAMAGYNAMRDPASNSPAPWIVLGTAFNVFKAMTEAAPSH